MFVQNLKPERGGKFYLVDSGYSNRIGYLAPFKGSRYHQQFRVIERRRTTTNLRELFNKVHASLRSVVERNFSAWKNRWEFIQNIPRYDFANVQVQLVGASTALHNYIHRNIGNPTTVNPICNEEEVMTIVNGIPEVAHDEDGLMTGDENPHITLVQVRIRDKLVYMRNNEMLGNI
ncbi:uncharacterized protein LOC114310611 [Camellia sinensis]|uniref:uncharacterized protein LOC114310611 n=1 Tax=Camellia sinensis TaxID=4442 RepID=UPI0010369847|nr:uncharacterized protein LOC114310611 [Camellia sinensis]